MTSKWWHQSGNPASNHMTSSRHLCEMHAQKMSMHSMLKHWNWDSRSQELFSPKLLTVERSKWRSYNHLLLLVLVRKRAGLIKKLLGNLLQGLPSVSQRYKPKKKKQLRSQNRPIPEDWTWKYLQFMTRCMILQMIEDIIPKLTSVRYSQFYYRQQALTWWREIWFNRWAQLSETWFRT